jgi:hypothetical protein
MKKNNNSFVYKNLRIYRFILNILYLGQYKNRFLSITNSINIKEDKKIVELCFGDILIANWCYKNNLLWFGIDINDNFLKTAKKNHHNVQKKYIDNKIILPDNNLVIIAGSLYHFNDSIISFIDNILSQTSKLIILEPIFNLSKLKILNTLLKYSSNIDSKSHNFRYTEENLINIINKLDNSKFKINISKPNWKDLLIVIKKNEN